MALGISWLEVFILKLFITAQDGKILNEAFWAEVGEGLLVMVHYNCCVLGDASTGVSNPVTPQDNLSFVQQQVNTVADNRSSNLKYRKATATPMAQQPLNREIRHSLGNEWVG